MEAPIPKKPDKEIKEIIKYKVELEFNQNNYELIISDINNDKIKFILLEKDNSCNKYEAIFNLEYFYLKNKYFKMFDKLNSLENDLIEIIKEKNIEIININSKEITIQLKVLSRTDNLVNFQLEKIKLNETETMDILLNNQIEISKIKKEFLTFKSNSIIENNKLKEELKVKHKKINELEQRLSKLENEFNKLLHNTSLNDDKEIKSNIFNDKKEIDFILGNITKDNNNVELKLLFDSNVEGENDKKLINAYTQKNDIIIVVKTKKNNRFGGYCHECFEKGIFSKSDKNAFLFSLDKLKIYKSKGGTYTIWRDNKYVDCLNSINFGEGTDLRIFHKFIKEKNYVTNYGYDYEYNQEQFPLINEKYFEILFLEIYQIQFK